MTRNEIFISLCDDIMPGYLLSHLYDINTVPQATSLWKIMREDVSKHHTKYEKGDCMTTHLSEAYNQCALWWWENCDTVSIGDIVSLKTEE